MIENWEGARTPQQEKVSILLVDDRQENLTALEAVLASPAYDLVKATSGQEALRHLLDRDFALILLDVQMPDMDGFETANYIRARERSRQTPIIFVTAISKEERFVYRGYESGAVDYIFKPFEPTILRSKVAVFVDLHRKNRQLQVQAEAMREHERMERERQIVRLELESLRRYQNLADAIPHVIWKIQPNCFLDYANRVWLDYSGLSAEQTAGKGWLQSFHPEDAANFDQAWQGANLRHRPLEFECRLRRQVDNTYRWHLLRLVPELDFARRVVAWLCTATDIHERKTSRQELERAKEYAEAANNAKSRFLANVSHEIRTPLGAILGFAELMTDPQQAKQDRDNCVETIRRNGQQLLRIIDEVLDLSKIEAGRLEIEKIAVDLRSLVEDVRNLFEVQTQGKGLGLTLRWDESVPAAVVTDPTRLRQILTNVIGNSVKFTSEGQVELSVSAVPLGPREGGGGAESSRMRIRFLVKDSGCGLGEEQKRRLFQPFGQADMTITRKFGGTGLGLALSRQLARSLEGNVELVESAPGQGSVFAIEIVADVAAKLKVLVPRVATRPIESAKKGERLKGLKILLAEDGPDNRILITRMLQMNGAEVASVDNGRDVIGKALEGDYDLILMDIQMPIMNGYDATKSLRKASYRKPIIALTAYAMKEERERCLSMGCDDYLTKPIDYPEFLAKITTTCFGEKELTADCSAS